MGGSADGFLMRLPVGEARCRRCMLPCSFPGARRAGEHQPDRRGGCEGREEVRAGDVDRHGQQPRRAAQPGLRGTQTGPCREGEGRGAPQGARPLHLW